MADYTITVNLPDHHRGDHWPAGVGSVPGRLGIGPVLIDGVTPSTPLDRMRFRFKHATSGQVFTIDSAEAGRNAPLVIDDAATWECHIPEIANFLPSAGEWEWDAEAYDAGRSTPLTIYKGVFTVHPDV